MTQARRTTGARTDHLRQAWHALARRPRLRGADRRAHALYAQWERLRHGLPLMADLASARIYLRVEGARPPADPVHVRVRPLGGATFVLRPQTTDALSLRDTFRDNVHPPPTEAERRGIRHIVDLGANIGATVAHNALLHPQARVLGVELDPGTAAVARRNVAPWADRCEILQGAVWTEDGEIAYARAGLGEHGFRVTGEPAADARTRALSMATIFSHLPAGARVDYLKMDVEGVEQHLLAPGHDGWAGRVGALSLQVHDPYTLEDCARDLERLGFVARTDPRRLNYIVGVRPG